MKPDNLRNALAALERLVESNLLTNPDDTEPADYRKAIDQVRAELIEIRRELDLAIEQADRDKQITLLIRLANLARWFKDCWPPDLLS